MTDISDFIPPDASPGVQQALREIKSVLREIQTQNVDLHGRRIINAGDPHAGGDYVTHQQLRESLAAVRQGTVGGATSPFSSAGLASVVVSSPTDTRPVGGQIQAHLIPYGGDGKVIPRATRNNYLSSWTVNGPGGPVSFSYNGSPHPPDPGVDYYIFFTAASAGDYTMTATVTDTSGNTVAGSLTLTVPHP